ncbi:MAG: maleylpyruvate isomerase N-terminal domain-containing protein, partial [Acidimicrobiales bacterium]|nr:maleylpyruvate isomerase N-terminal domain-containing protein [Acidimicrobiales bacterium]
MSIELDRQRIVGGLEQIWSEWADWSTALSDGGWATPSRCPGWTVQDNLAHIIGTERMLQGHEAPEVEFPT